MSRSQGEKPSPECDLDSDALSKRERIAHVSSYALQVIGTVFIFVTWASDGEHWSYIETGDFKLGGRGFCNGSSCQVAYYSEVPAERMSPDHEAAAAVPATLLILYLIEIILATVISGALLTWSKRSSRAEPVRYHKFRSILLYTMTGVFATQAAVGMLWVFIVGAMFSLGFWLAAIAVPAFLLAAYLEHSLHSTLSNENWHEDHSGERRNASWKTRSARLLKRCVGFLWRSQLWSCFAAVFYIMLNIIIMSHDIRRPEVQSYIENELRPWSNGDPRFTDVRPSFFGADQSCSYFPVTNIPAQGGNRVPLVFFFIYHIGICAISLWLIIDELCDVRFGILGPQQNKTGAAWTSFYLFSATMSRSILFWSRGWVMACNIASWVFFGVASLNILDYYLLSNFRGPSIKDIKRGDRHAALRTGIGTFRGPLWLPLVGRYLLKLQQSIMEGDSSRCLRGVSRWQISPEDEAKLEKMKAMMGDCTEDCIKKANEKGCPDHPPLKLSRKAKRNHPSKLRRRLDQRLGWMSRYPHFPKGGGLVGKPRSRCDPCNRGRNCTHASHTLWRGFPWHRSSLKDEKANNIWIEYFLDIRRLSCIVCAFLLFIVQFGSFISELSTTARWRYRSQMQEQMTDWVAAATGSGHWWNEWQTPLLLSECSHFHYSSVPVAFISVKSHDTTVRYSTAIAGLNRVFLMGMCFSIMLVSWLNQRYFGQMLPVISLIGPRLSSISVGLTLVHVAVSTGSQSLFADNLMLYKIGKGVVYAGLVVGSLSCILTEDFSYCKSNKKGEGNSFMRSRRVIQARRQQDKRLAKEEDEEFERRLARYTGGRQPV